MWRFNRGIVPICILLFGHFNVLYLNAWQVHCGSPKLLEFQNVCHQMHYTTLHSYTLQSRTGHQLAIPPCVMLLYIVFVIPQHVGMCRSALPCLCITFDHHRRIRSTNLKLRRTQQTKALSPFHIFLSGHFNVLSLGAWQVHYGFHKLFEFQTVCHPTHYTTLHSHTLRSRTGHQLAIPPCVKLLYIVFVIPQHVGMCHSALPCLCITLDPHRRTYSTVPPNTFGGHSFLLTGAFTATPMHHTTLLCIGASHAWHSIVIPFPAEFTLSTTPTTTTTSHSHIPDQHLTTISHPANAHGQFSAHLAC
jgi:hypothetical protein